MVASLAVMVASLAVMVAILVAVEEEEEASPSLVDRKSSSPLINIYITEWARSATYYLQNGVQGACGKANPDSSMICALYTSVFDGGKHCGKTVKVTNLKNGKTVNVIAAGKTFLLP
jgi:hypothetical protein